MYNELLWERLEMAFKDCLKHKKNKHSTLNFYDDRLYIKMYDLYDELLNFNYKLNKSTRHIISDPAWREIYAADFKDRIVHHFFMNEINSILEEELIDNCTSCRKDKGTSYALENFKKYMMNLSNNYQNEVYCLKIDLSGYFMRINREVLTAKFKNLIEKKYNGAFKKLLIYLCDFIFLDNPATNCRNCFNEKLLLFVPERRILNPSSICGMAIGNLPAQAGSNYYLNDFDHTISDIFFCYIRYVDDIVILSNDKEKLKNNFNYIINELSKYGQKPNKRKTKIINAKYGVKFLGKVTYPSGVQKPSKGVCIRTLYHASILNKNDNHVTEKIAAQIGSIKNYNCRKLISEYNKIVSLKLDI